MDGELQRALGQLEGRFDGFEDKLKEFSEFAKNTTVKLSSLPCVEHQNKIEVLESCAELISNNNKEKLKGNISLRNSVIIAIVTFTIGIATALITSLIAVGTP